MSKKLAPMGGDIHRVEAVSYRTADGEIFGTWAQARLHYLDWVLHECCCRCGLAGPPFSAAATEQKLRENSLELSGILAEIAALRQRLGVTVNENIHVPQKDPSSKENPQPTQKTTRGEVLVRENRRDPLEGYGGHYGY